MNEPVGFAQLPRPVQFQLAALGPLLLGLVCGFFLGISAASFWVVNGLGILGGLLGGLEYPPAASGGAPVDVAVASRSPRREAAARGAVAGAMFGLGVYIAHVASGDPAHAPLPSPEFMIVPFSAVIGCGLAFLGLLAAQRQT
jgi:hypothetical protein